jgi:hypothetical protein
MIEMPVEPANEEVVHQRQDPCCTDSVVSSNIGKNCRFRRKANV